MRKSLNAEATMGAKPPRNPQSVYSLLGVPYNVLATKQSDPMLCKFLKMRLREFSNPPFRTIALILETG